jgi:tRNA modification GTPase
MKKDTIIAISTPPGIGAVAIIRLSGGEALRLVQAQFNPHKKNKDLSKVASHTLHLGEIYEGSRTIDEVLVTVFKNPNSYTGEDVVEINCHGSVYIQKEIIQLFIKKGVRHADPGEFTLRAFLNGKIELTQAEAVADLIASNSSASHQVAMQQMRRGFSNDLKNLRQELLNFSSLIELELDFSQEDVAFADRSALKELVSNISKKLKKLIDSFAIGNAFKNGIPVVIIGKPNAGKSTLLNLLFNEEKAIVSDVKGTTRDAIEDELIVKGISYRFIDTAGIRDTNDKVERIGIEKTFKHIENSQLVLHLLDASDNANIKSEIDNLKKKYPSKKIIPILNKSDLVSQDTLDILLSENQELVILSAIKKHGLELLLEAISNLYDRGALLNNDIIISNSRHFEALSLAFKAINEVKKGIALEISSDLLAIDIRETLIYLGEITGEVTNDELLGNIFSNFCIGK